MIAVKLPAMAFAFMLGAHGAGAWGNQITSAPATPVAQAEAQDDAAFIRTLRRDMAEALARLDGADVTGLRASGPCTATITTADGATDFAWGALGDLVTDDYDDLAVLVSLMADGQQHAFALRSGEAADRVMSSLELLAMQCEGK